MNPPIAYGIDFGTTNSAVSIAYGDRVEVLPVEEQDPVTQLRRSCTCTATGLKRLVARLSGHISRTATVRPAAPTVLSSIINSERPIVTSTGQVRDATTHV